jgi:hypothetical protein
MIRLSAASTSGRAASRPGGAFSRQTHRLGARVQSRAFPLQQALGRHARDQIGQGRAVDAGHPHQFSLGQTGLERHRLQHRELALGQAVGAGLLGIDVERQLQGAVHQVARRGGQGPDLPYRFSRLHHRAAPLKFRPNTYQLCFTI